MYLLSDQRSGCVVALPALDADALPQPLVPPAPIGRLAQPAGLCLDPRRRLHIADAGNGRIVSYDFGTGAWTTYGAGTLGNTTGVAADSASRVYAVDGEKLVRADDVDGSNPVEIPLPPTTRPVAVAAADSARLVIVDARSRGLLVGDAAGAAWTPHPLPAGAPSSTPISVAARSDGGVLVADLGGRRIVGVDAGGNATTLIEASDGLLSPIAAVEDGPGITVADAGAGWIRRFLPVGGRYVAADFVRGRRRDGTFRFDRIAGLALGALP